MTKRFQILVGCFLFVLGTTSFSAFAAATNNVFPIIGQTTAVVADEGPLGVWGYEVEGMEEAYRKGVLFVRLENEKYIVEVNLSNGTLNGQDVQIAGNTIKFMVNIEGTERVSVVLNTSGDTMLGEVDTSQGTFVIKGTRKLPPM